MKLDLNRIFDQPGETMTVEHRVELSDIRFWGRRPFAEPVAVKAEVINRAGVVTLDLSADFTMNLTCDRCLAAFERRFTPHFTHIVVRELAGEDQDDYVVAPGGQLDLDELALTDLVPELPIKFLCREDCKGLCDQCGCNLNETVCGCNHKVADPRLAALDRFFDE